MHTHFYYFSIFYYFLVHLSISLVLPQLLVPSSQFLVNPCQFFIQMYLPITNLLLKMCFFNLIQIQTIPTTTGPTSPMYTPTKNHRQTCSGNLSRHTYTSKQLWAIHDQVNPTSLTNPPFGSIRRIRELGLNRKPMTIRINKNQHTNPKRKAEIRNLRQVPKIDKSNHEIVQTIRVSTVNARSLKHNENFISKEKYTTPTQILQ